MSMNITPLTDELLRRALSELATGPDGDTLLTDVLRLTDTAPQIRRWPWDVRGGRRAMFLLAAVLLLTAALGATVIVSGWRPHPQPTPSAQPVLPNTISVHDFVAPFTYSLPPGQSTLLTQSGSQSPAVMWSLEHIDYAQRPASRRLQVFLITGSVHRCGAAATPDAQGTTTVTGRTLSLEPSAFLEELRDNVGVGITSISETTLGNLPAVTAEIDPARSTCQGTLLHESGFGLAWASKEPKLDNPSVLTVAYTGSEQRIGRTIGVLISASTKEDLAAWLPIAQAYAGSFVFDKTGP